MNSKKNLLTESATEKKKHFLSLTPFYPKIADFHVILAPKPVSARKRRLWVLVAIWYKLMC